MKNTTSLIPEASSDYSFRAKSFMKSFIAGLIMTAFTLGAKPAKAQESSSPVQQDTTKTEKVETPKSGGSFMIDPMYSFTDKTALVRFQGGGSVHGLQIGGFLDVSGTDGKEGINTAFGKITVAKNLGKHGTSAAMEYTLHTSASDKLRVGIKQVIKINDGSVVFKVYPLSDKGFEPFVMIGADHKLGKYFGISSFVGSDIKSKSYYSESEITVGSGKIQGIGQVRIGGTYTTKPKAGVYTGFRIKL